MRKLLAILTTSNCTCPFGEDAPTCLQDNLTTRQTMSMSLVLSVVDAFSCYIVGLFNHFVYITHTHTHTHTHRNQAVTDFRLHELQHSFVRFAQLSIINCQLSIIHYQLSIINCLRTHRNQAVTDFCQRYIASLCAILNLAKPLSVRYGINIYIYQFIYGYFSRVGHLLFPSIRISNGRFRDGLPYLIISILLI
jgi:hypothetical protein